MSDSSLKQKNIINLFLFVQFSTNNSATRIKSMRGTPGCTFFNFTDYPMGFDSYVYWKLDLKCPHII